MIPVMVGHGCGFQWFIYILGHSSENQQFMYALEKQDSLFKLPIIPGVRVHVSMAQGSAQTLPRGPECVFAPPLLQIESS